MKFLMILVHLLFVPKHQTADSVNFRIYNNSKYLIKDYTITIADKKYSYQNILPHSYSQYKCIPVVYKSNADECTVLVRPFLSRQYTVTLTEIPIDHIADIKIDHGSTTLTLNVENHHKHIDWRPTFKQD